jgi:hypothetical protein
MVRVYRLHDGCKEAPPLERPPLELAEVLRRNYDACAARFRLTPEQHATARALMRCRTAALGAHVCHCRACGHDELSYNSCLNRHCPKCQGAAQAQWIAQREARVLATHYFHVVFTLPEALRAVALANPKPVYALLLRAAATTLLALGADPKRLGAELGVTAVLHTWTRDLRLHPHVHCIVTGGGLSADGSRWVSARSEHLFPGRVLAALFRGKLLAGLEELRTAGALRLEGACAELAHPVAWADVKDRLYRTRWVVYAKRPFAGPQQVIRYLGRYTHRVALSNSRLVAFEPDDRVRFRTRGRHETTLPGVELVRRFLLHVLPKRFVKIRHFGLMASAHVPTRLARARELLTPKVAETTPEASEGEASALTLGAPLPPLWALRCPACGSTDLIHVFSAPRLARGPPAVAQVGAVHA